MSQQSAWTLLSFGPNGWGDELLAGAFVTLQLAAVSLAVGLVLGLALAISRLSPFAPLRWFANGYNLFIRGTPEFLVLLLVYFGLEQFVRAIAELLGLSVTIDIPKFVAAVAGLSLIFASYASEVFRGAYLAVPKGQMEAATSCGMSDSQAFFRIRLPQMWRFAIPGLGNLWMVLLKDTSLAAVIALDELLRQAKVASESTREPLLFYLAAGALYLILTGVSDLVRYRLERASQRGVRRA
jgi:His/Glu/Gln/Arg/opine family amino acid ABC transporter permease subunit